ncbi:hypothetical protein GOP47_0002530 [Adiantum capillus-veneris]|uniref:Branched-chain-amino-acid aminotransferase n=1 Tax=Adiantum capillus-veneris TaxID=13818 RepID=A0A9D4VAU9_ADICA|nr:hypothetical protein GOP47_0002530 [Adiantum capillus-veneris]
MASLSFDQLVASSSNPDFSSTKCRLGSYPSYRGFHSHSLQARSSQRPLRRTFFINQQAAFCARADVAAVTLPNEIKSSLEIDWDNLGFGYHETDFIYVSKCGPDGEWNKGELEPFGPLKLSPSAGILNYGQGIFEGLKAYKTEDDRVLLFRPEENAMRMIVGADRLCMPTLPVNLFVQAVKQTVLANKRWIPPPGKGSLYIRPILMGSGAVLGLAPAPEYTFVIFVAPVGNYFKEGLAPIHLKVENTYHRAAPGGTGGVKTVGNYASVLKTQLNAKKHGFSDVLYLDAVENKYLEEVSSCNIFLVEGNKLATPQLKGTILPGITRKSVIELAKSRGYEVEERPVSVDELRSADEVFCTGTAVVISPVGSIVLEGDRLEYANKGVGKVSQELYAALTSIQMGKAADTMGWTKEI